MIESTTTVSCQHVCKKFGDQPILTDLNLDVLSGEILVLLGPSGCGKTTTLRLIAGFDTVDKGMIEIAGQLVADGNGLHIPPERRRTGMVFQEYAIFPHLSVFDNVRFGLSKGEKAGKRAQEMLDFVGMSELGQRMPHTLSGGQQQRIALARALAPKPRALLLDEPFSNLDATLRKDVRSEVRRLLKASQTTVIFVTHDHEEALFLGDKVAVMNEGRLEQLGTPAQIFHQPITRFVAEFVGQTDFLPGVVGEQFVMTPLGELPQSVSLAAGTLVDVMLRADDVRITPDEGGNGRIVDRQFAGIANIYQVCLENGAVVHSWQPHTVNLAEGTAVRTIIQDEHPQPIFYNGRVIDTA